MARSTLWLRVVAVAALAAQTVADNDGTCYYPNGVEASPSEQPCSTADGSACCPLDWECLDNGLCHYPQGDLSGSYSCTDPDWKAPGCPSNICIYGPEKERKRPGGESITRCSTHNDDWCCNADAQHVDCCAEKPAPRPFFKLQDGKAYATIGKNQASTVPTLSSITGLATSSGGGSQPSRTPTPSSSAAASSSKADPVSRSTSGSPTPVPSVSISLSSGSGGVVPVTILSTPTASGASSDGTDGNNNSSGGGSSSNLGVIIGCAVGVPLALALLGILIWLLRKRRTQKKSPYAGTPEMEHSPKLPGTPGFAAGAKLRKEVYRHSRPGTTEIDGAPIGATRPVSNVPGHAELPSGAGFQPGQGPAYTPDTVGIGGGNGDGRATWGSAPPSYSPGMNQARFAHPTNAMELADTSIMPVINEKEGVQQYQAYRPPQPAAELPTVKTPPEDLERQVQK